MWNGLQSYYEHTLRADSGQFKRACDKQANGMQFLLHFGKDSLVRTCGVVRTGG